MKLQISRLKVRASNVRTGIGLTSRKYNRLKLIAMLKNKCYYCGKTLQSNKLHIHHLDMNRKNNSFSNFALLCHSCHEAYHKQMARTQFAIIESIESVGFHETRDISTPIWHNYLLDNYIITHNSYKSSAVIEIARFMDSNFSADKIAFSNQELLDITKEQQEKGFILRDEITEEYGVGSGRMQAFLQMQAETLRKKQISFGYISPELKPIGTEHYILHTIGHNDFKADNRGQPLEPVYVLVGVMNPSTHNYLGGVIINIEWNNPVWRAYDKKKDEFMKRVQDMDFAKQDMEQLAQKCFTDPLAKFAKTKSDWLIIIQRVHPSLTTEEGQMVYAMIKMIGRIKMGQTNGDFEQENGEDNPD